MTNLTLTRKQCLHRKTHLITRLQFFKLFPCFSYFPTSTLSAYVEKKNMGKGRWGGICGLNSLIQRVFVNVKLIMWADFFHLHNYSRIMLYLYWTANQTPSLDQLFDSMQPEV